MPKHIKPGSKEARYLKIEKKSIDEDARTVELAFSSEEPYERYWGIEVLDHAKASIRLGRLNNGGPLLMDHDSRDHVGVIESVVIGADKVGRAVVRFGKGARADEIFQDVKDGIRSHVSVGYMIHKALLEESGDDGDIYRVTDWEPFEVSMVSVPADATVGVGRSADVESTIEIIEEPEQKIEVKKETKIEVRSVDMPGENKIDETAIEQRGVKSERQRVTDLVALGTQFKHYDGEKMAMEFIAANRSVDDLKAELLKKAATQPTQTAEIGMSGVEVKRYSIVRALHALANPADRKAQDAATFERECSEAVGQRLGRSAQGLFVPYDVQRRDLNAGAATAGGNLVGTDLMSGSFIEQLRNKMVIAGMGTQFLDGLVGDIAIPKQTGGATAYWLAESGAPTESQQVVGQVNMSPKTVGAFTDISRKLLKQSSIGVEGFVQNDLASVLGLAIQLGAIQGGGANEPTGILNTVGIGDVAGGTNGLAPTWGHIVDLESDVAVADADVGSLGYLTNAKVRGKLKKTFVDAGSNAERVWDKGADPLNGYKGEVTNAVPSNLTKGTSVGVCSSIIYGNFSDLVVGLWGGLDLLVDPYTGGTSGTVRVIAHQDVDVAVRNAESFSAMLDALTV